jgi:hydrogenase 3 maturation protease
VYDCGTSPENYLGKVIKDAPATVVLIDAVDFAGEPGEIRELFPEHMQAGNLFATHNASLGLAANYLQNNLKADIIIVAIQPKRLDFDDKLSPEVEDSVGRLKEWFYETAKGQG